MSNIGYSIMAHPKRKEYAESLAEEIGCNISYDTGKGLWENARNSWLLAHEDVNEDGFAVVIQDDAILCDNFKSKVSVIANKYPDFAVCLYMGENLKSLKGKVKKPVTIHNRIHWGVGLMLPTKHIKPFLEFGDKWTRRYGTKHCDTRLCRYCRRVGLEVVYPFPSLVDHRQIPSLNGDSIGRRAYEF